MKSKFLRDIGRYFYQNFYNFKVISFCYNFVGSEQKTDVGASTDELLNSGNRENMNIYV